LVCVYISSGVTVGAIVGTFGCGRPNASPLHTTAKTIKNATQAKIHITRNIVIQIEWIMVLLKVFKEVFKEVFKSIFSSNRGKIGMSKDAFIFVWFTMEDGDNVGRNDGITSTGVWKIFPWLNLEGNIYGKHTRNARNPPAATIYLKHFEFSFIV